MRLLLILLLFRFTSSQLLGGSCNDSSGTCAPHGKCMNGSEDGTFWCRASSSADYSFPLPLGETPMVSLTTRVPLLGMITRQFRMADRIGNPLPNKNGSEVPPTSPTVD
uniref:EGF-like domain-containing protein n=1 Tax=Caenorhabditis tropicalis TaxID=1561998 RepID=A0A1I7U5Q8_9PELO